MKRTLDEKKSWYKKMANLAADIKKLSDERRAEIVTQCGTINVEGRTLSAFNTCFLWMQAGGPLAQVGGFRQWQKVGRRVMEGQHAKGYIYVPMKGKKDQELSEDEKMRFKLVPVFDVKQTEKMQK